jgi:hypothetical protein
LKEVLTCFLKVAMGADLRAKVFSERGRNNNELMAFEEVSGVKGRADEELGDSGLGCRTGSWLLILVAGYLFVAVLWNRRDFTGWQLLVIGFK